MAGVQSERRAVSCPPHLDGKDQRLRPHWQRLALTNLGEYLHLTVRNTKNSRRIVVRNAVYRWRAKGNDDCISIGIWPENNIGPSIHGNLGYHQTWLDTGDGILRSAGDQIVVTSRLIERIIDYAINQHHYDPNAKGKQLDFRRLDDLLKWDDAVRASDHPGAAVKE